MMKGAKSKQIYLENQSLDLIESYSKHTTSIYWRWSKKMKHAVVMTLSHQSWIQDTAPPKNNKHVQREAIGGIQSHVLRCTNGIDCHKGNTEKYLEMHLERVPPMTDQVGKGKDTEDKITMNNRNLINIYWAL